MASDVKVFKRLKKRKSRKKRLRKSSKATTTGLYRYPRHTDIFVIPDLRNPKRLILTPFPPGNVDAIAAEISSWLLAKHRGKVITNELLVDMTQLARWKFCQMRGIKISNPIEEIDDDEAEEDPSQSMADLEFYLGS